jgi:hypothetical protein
VRCQLFFSATLDETESARFLESPLDYPLVDVPEEGRDVLAPFRRLVIPHQQWLEADGHTILNGRR